MNGKTHFKNLDSIRFMAAMMVLLGHLFSPLIDNIPKSLDWLKALLSVLTDGNTGVSIFFVLSGFLITYILIEEYRNNAEISLKRFYERRILRIWPLYFVTLMFSFLIYPFLKQVSGTDYNSSANFIYHLFFLSNFDLINILQFNADNALLHESVTWSISVEEQFYLIWPLIFLFVPNRFWFFGLIIMFILSMIFNIIYAQQIHHFHFHTLTTIIYMTMGGIMAYLIVYVKKIRDFFEKTNTIHHFFILLISFSLLFWHEQIFSFRYGQLIGRISLSTLFATFIASQAMTKENSILNLGNFRFADRWGKYTYGIYLLHPIILSLLLAVTKSMDFSDSNLLSIFFIGMVVLILIFPISKMSYIYFESYFLNMKNRNKI